jgi:molybdopterin biosynthesis enzyme MoaB
MHTRVRTHTHTHMRAHAHSYMSIHTRTLNFCLQDKVEAIAEEVKRHKQVDVMITSGGVGPTLDDGEFCS